MYLSREWQLHSLNQEVPLSETEEYNIHERWKHDSKAYANLAGSFIPRNHSRYHQPLHPLPPTLIIKSSASAPRRTPVSLALHHLHRHFPLTVVFPHFQVCSSPTAISKNLQLGIPSCRISPSHPSYSPRTPSRHIRTRRTGERLSRTDCPRPLPGRRCMSRSKVSQG